MGKGINYQYYVEGEDEKKLLNVLKGDMGCIKSGKVDRFNVVQNEFTFARIRPLKLNTIVVLVYDTDIDKTDTFENNIKFLKKQTAVKDIVLIPQVMNLEDEIVRACGIKKVEELTRSCSMKDYKKDLIHCANLGKRLKECRFDISVFWTQMPRNGFKKWGNDAEKIKRR